MRGRQRLYNTIYPGYIRPYQGVNNRIVKRKEDEEQSQSSNQAREYQQETQKEYAQYPKNQFPNGEHVAIDYSKPNVNIAQIITDFKNTTNAIGAPEEISNEVFSYLQLVDSQSKKSNPSRQIIQSNLKNASQILDGYITETLNKPSKVVENWIEALFLQSIDYKGNPSEINPDFQIQLPEKTANAENEPTQEIQETEIKPSYISLETEHQSEENNQNNNSKSGIYIPQDKQLKRMFLQAKKFAEIDNPEKALNSFKQTLEYAKKIDDTQAQGMVYYEVGKLYDKNDVLPEAVISYNKAIETSQDNNIKARSHLSMAQIYDDVVEFEPAVDHYFAAISFAGESDNLNAQTKALTSLANMYSNRYDKKNTFEYVSLATDIAKETGNDKIIASVYKKSADMSSKLEENPKALDFYKESTRYYSKAQLPENVVQNYQQASDIMLKLGDKTKAKTLLQKAYIKSQTIENSSLSSQIAQQLAKL